MTDKISMSNPFSLTDSHIVVTGGSRGIGRAITLALCQAGATVSIVARDAEQAAETVGAVSREGGIARAHPADVSDIGSLEDLVSDLSHASPIDGVVHAAGIQLRKPAVEVTPDEFLRIQNVNLHAPYFLSTAIARHQQLLQRSGSHVFIGSLNSTIALPNISPYVVAKTGLVGVARSFSTEWASQNIRANVIGPGYFATEMTKELLATSADRERILARIPMRTLGNPADIGHASVYLLSRASSYVTGALLNVDGGWLAS